jgi:hypothetical protein
LLNLTLLITSAPQVFFEKNKSRITGVLDSEKVETDLNFLIDLLDLLKNLELFYLRRL